MGEAPGRRAVVDVGDGRVVVEGHPPGQLFIGQGEAATVAGIEHFHGPNFFQAVVVVLDEGAGIVEEFPAVIDGCRLDDGFPVFRKLVPLDAAGSGIAAIRLRKQQGRGYWNAFRQGLGIPFVRSHGKGAEFEITSKLVEFRKHRMAFAALISRLARHAGNGQGVGRREDDHTQYSRNGNSKPT